MAIGMGRTMRVRDCCRAAPKTTVASSTPPICGGLGDKVLSLDKTGLSSHQLRSCRAGIVLDLEGEESDRKEERDAVSDV